MKTGWLIAILLGVPAVQACQIAKPASASNAVQTASASNPQTAKPDFNTDIKPIFQARCQPCHFQGGQVYEKLPFDKPETIRRLGTRLFTRIKDEKEQRLIREFLDQ
jgi:uncharacterized membrane protein